VKQSEAGQVSWSVLPCVLSHSLVSFHCFCSYSNDDVCRDASTRHSPERLAEMKAINYSLGCLKVCGNTIHSIYLSSCCIPAILIYIIMSISLFMYTC
jgi:hypothetical protein